MNQQYDEAILLNTALNVADGSVSNVYMVIQGQIFTPPIKDGALPGVVRSILLEELNHKYPILERSIHPEELLAADEVFLTNALMGVKTVSRLNTRTFESHSVANRIADALRNSMDYI